MGRKRFPHIIAFAALSLALLVAQISCGGHSSSFSNPMNPGNPGSSNSANAICNCVKNQAESDDYRTQAKHVDLPPIAANEINVATILGWAVGTDPAFDAPRQGREQQMFHIGQAFLQFAWLNPGDCDLHLEISDSPDKNAPRVIVETPHMNSFCTARVQLQQQLAAKGFSLSTSSGELSNPVAVDVLGLAFEDFHHPRGSARVATFWELHPAIVTLK